MEKKLFVININDKGYEEIDMKMIKRLAGIAMSLDAESGISVADGKRYALEDYISKSTDVELKAAYKRIINIMFANKLLADTIELMTIEEDMREFGITDSKLSFYQALCNEYQKYFSISNDISNSLTENGMNK